MKVNKSKNIRWRYKNIHNTIQKYIIKILKIYTKIYIEHIKNTQLKDKKYTMNIRYKMYTI